MRKREIRLRDVPVALGHYLIRHEIIARRLVVALGRAKFFPACSESASVAPKRCSQPDSLLPSAYNDNDLGIYDPGGSKFMILLLESRRARDSSNSNFSTKLLVPVPKFFRFPRCVVGFSYNFNRGELFVDSQSVMSVENLIARCRVFPQKSVLRVIRVPGR